MLRAARAGSKNSLLLRLQHAAHEPSLVHNLVIKIIKAHAQCIGMTLVAVATPRILATAILFCISVCFLPSIICSAALLHKACVTRYARCFLCTTKRPFCARALDIRQQQRE
jgi:flagellar biosynthesis protein FliQ